MGQSEKDEAERKFRTAVGERDQPHDRTIAWSALHDVLQSDCSTFRGESIRVRQGIGQARGELHDAANLTVYYRQEAHEETRAALLARQDIQAAQYHEGRYQSEIEVMGRKRENFVESRDALVRHADELTKDVIWKNRDELAGEDPGVMKERLIEAERQIHEHKLEAQKAS